jgi:hypothetical protein
MKSMLIFLVLLIAFTPAKAQEKRVEVFDVQRNVLISGIVTDSVGDSLFVFTDNSKIITFAKSDLQGSEYGVSKEIRKLQMKIIREEAKLIHFEFPGNYQIRKGEVLKGKAIQIITKAGLACIIIGSTGTVLSLPLWIGGLAANLMSLVEISGFIFTGSLYTFVAGSSIIGFSGLWSIFDSINDIKNKVKNRYYYTGGSMQIMTTEQTLL